MFPNCAHNQHHLIPKIKRWVLDISYLQKIFLNFLVQILGLWYVIEKSKNLNRYLYLFKFYFASLNFIFHTHWFAFRSRDSKGFKIYENKKIKTFYRFCYIWLVYILRLGNVIVGTAFQFLEYCFSKLSKGQKITRNTCEE